MRYFFLIFFVSTALVFGIAGRRGTLTCLLYTSDAADE